ncbi:serpentine type 7TM GPCR chemoreceptor srsx domain-containing protein [Ditylenchus destructor]|uniref:Serpentine type 7TM GPCR chemoreceptor srsx domain-containing protein n=1 Tax=Ditylenchus destructor TaxID=166010 RepID=A0AAD4QS43_9BILA|nr:serpentine type 7TM GPCR chemoreceptor srsx domain-containing protein [Ditylenchus destructor]
MHLIEMASNSSDDSLLTLYKHAGVSPVLVLIVGARWLIGTLGIVSNACLVYVTAKSSWLRSPCNILICINALLCAVCQYNHSVPMFLVLTGINFIPISTCFYFMALPLTANFMVNCYSLAIGIDRLISVLFPLWQRKVNIFLYISVIILICAINPTFMMPLYLPVLREFGDKQVMCFTTDLSAYGKVAEVIYPMGLAFNVAIVVVYLLLWLVLKLKGNKAATNYTRKIFKSLAMIMAVTVIGWMLSMLVRSFVLPYVKLSPFNKMLLSTFLTCFVNIAMLSDSPILCIFSQEYRRAFNIHLFSHFCTKIDDRNTDTNQSPLFINRNQ